MFKLKIFISLFLLFFSYLPAEEINLKISLKNGTTGGIGKADTIKLIALQGGMVPIGEFQNKQGDFVLEKINFPDEAPVLIQVSYKGANYNKMVPPAPMFRTKLQEIIVYEVTSEFKGIDIKSLMQIIREENSIRVYKIFLIDMNEDYLENNSNERKVIDYLSGMTDRYIKKQYEKYCSN